MFCIGINLLPYFFNKHFWKSYEDNCCKTALNRIFNVKISKIRVLNNKILLIFELLNFAVFSWTFAYFPSHLTPAPFLWWGIRLIRLVFSRELNFVKIDLILPDHLLFVMFLIRFEPFKLDSYLYNLYILYKEIF